MRFRSLIFFIAVSAVTLPCLVLGILQYQSAKSDIHRAESARRDISMLVSDRLEGRIANSASLLKLIAQSASSIGIERPSALKIFLDNILRSNSDFLNVHIDGADARSIAFAPSINDNGESNTGIDHSDRAHWADRTKNTDIQISGLVHAKGAASGTIVNLSKPIYSHEKFVGLAVCALDLEKLSKKVLNNLPQEIYDVVIFDAAGKPIFGSSSTSAFPGLEKIAESGYIGYVHTLNWSGWRVGVFSKKLNRDAILRDLLIKNALIWLFTLVGSLILGLGVSYSVVRAIDKLTAQITAARSRPEKREEIRSPRELVLLQRTYSLMQERLEKAKDELKELNLSLEDKVEEKVEKIKEQEATLSAVFESMKEGFILFSATSNFVYVNHAAKSLMRDGIEKDYLGQILECNKGKSQFKQEVGTRTLEFRVFRIQESSAFLTGIMIRDVTSQVQLDRLKDELISVVAHELKTPLASARLSAEYIQKHVGQENCRDAAMDLAEDIEVMKNLIGNWLDSARIECGAYPFKLELRVLKPLIKKAVQLSGLTPQEVEIHFPKEAPAAFVDSEAFVRIAVNLLDNARKYRSQDRALKVEISARREADVLIITFRDNGQGIDEAVADKIFDRFYQVKMDSTRKAGGVGLGLAIIKQLVELHGGSISVHGKVGEGACFEICLPAKKIKSSEENDDDLF